MKKKKVLHVLRSNIYAGAESIAVHIIESLSEEYEFVYSCPDGPIAAVLEKKQIAYVPMKEFGIAQVKQVIDTVKPDVIHAHDYAASIACAVAAHGRSKVISHLHHDSPECRKWGKKAILYSIASFYIQNIIIVSKATIEGAVFEKRLADKTILLENPVDKEAIKRLAGTGDIDGDKNKDKEYDMLYVGRLSEKKDPMRFIRIVKQLKERGLRISAAMVGNGELYEACAAMIEQEKLTDSITLLGYQENPYPYINRARIFCMTSLEEGYGLAVMEAVTLNVPVLVTPVGNMKHFFQTGEELCTTDEEFCEKAEMLLKQPQIYEAWQARLRIYEENITAPAYYREELKKIYGE